MLARDRRGEGQIQTHIFEAIIIGPYSRELMNLTVRWMDN